MKLINFEIANDNIALTLGDYYFDLHNIYDFISFEYRVAKKQFFILWERNDGNWVEKNLPKNLKLNFSNTSFLKIKENEKDEFVKDDSCLDAIGFAEISVRENMDSWLCEGLEDDKSDMILIFLNGQTIKINAETVGLEISND